MAQELQGFEDLEERGMNEAPKRLRNFAQEQGWVIQSRQVTCASAATRVNRNAVFHPYELTFPHFPATYVNVFRSQPPHFINL